MTGVTPQREDQARLARFQSSPVGDDGCDTRRDADANVAVVFQSSPVGDDGCDDRHNQDNYAQCKFQSSPVGDDGCDSIFLKNRKMEYETIFCAKFS